MLTVYDINGGVHSVGDREGLAAMLARHNEQGRNFFTLTHDGTTESALAIAVRGEEAYVYYFPFPGSVGAGCFMMAASEDADGSDLETFWISSTDTIEVPRFAVVKLAQATSAALAFLASPERPSGFEWYDL